MPIDDADTFADADAAEYVHKLARPHGFAALHPDADSDARRRHWARVDAEKRAALDAVDTLARELLAKQRGRERG